VEILAPAAPPEGVHSGDAVRRRGG
jgi:hypothetical protein